MKTLQVVVHVLPREIDQFERLCNLFKESYFFVKDEINIVLDASLNLNEIFVDWENSQIPKEFFIEKFNNINELHSDWTHKNIFQIENSDKCLGINDKRRNSINDGLDYDYLMYLDLDVFFSHMTLVSLTQLINQIDTDYNIISPETVKLWDDSWADLVNEKYINHDHEFFKTIDPYSVHKLVFDNLVEEKIKFRTINNVKFGGGWFNVFSKKLLKFINIPESLGSYGLDDTFVMVGANMMKQKGYDVTQYILEGTICIENNKYTLYNYNPYDKFLADKSFENKGRTFKQGLRKKSNENFELELNKFRDRI